MKGFPRRVVGSYSRPSGLGEAESATILKLECSHEIMRGKGPRTVQCGQCRFELFAKKGVK